MPKITFPRAIPNKDFQEKHISDGEDLLIRENEAYFARQQKKLRTMLERCVQELPGKNIESVTCRQGPLSPEYDMVLRFTDGTFMCVQVGSLHLGNRES